MALAFRLRLPGSSRFPNPVFGQKRWQSTQPSQATQFSLYLSANSRKESVESFLNSVAKPEASNLSSASDSSSAVVLTTPTFSRWLEDPTFMSALLGSFTSQDVNLVAGVVDDIAPSNISTGPRSGFSVLGGRAGLLPSLWENEFIRPRRNAKPSTRPKLQFTLPSTSVGRHPIKATLPLANTIFHNGRESTLLACSWKSVSENKYVLSRCSEKLSQAVAYPSPSNEALSSVSAPLAPITPPRQIKGCFGNILSELDLDGNTQSASTELEAIVPEIYADQLDIVSAGEVSPVQIWAVVYPAQIRENASVDAALQGLQYAIPKSTNDDISAACLDNMDTISSLLNSGCQLYKLISGGGGWGKRKGRLSLDANWGSVVANKNAFDDIDPFPLLEQGIAASILQRDMAVCVGAYVQFFVAPASTGSFTLTSQRSRSVMFGKSPERLDNDPLSPVTQDSPPPELALGQFGAMSRECVFLEEDLSGDKEPRVYTQVDSPFSFVSV